MEGPTSAPLYEYHITVANALKDKILAMIGDPNMTSSELSILQCLMQEAVANFKAAEEIKK